MTSINGLHINKGIIVVIDENNGVGCRESESMSCNARCCEEKADMVLLLKVVNPLHSLLWGLGTGEKNIVKTFVMTKDLRNDEIENHRVL